MNSKQRRKFNRKWRYRSTVTEYTPAMPYYILDEIHYWCVRRFGKNGYVAFWDDSVGKIVFAFDSAEKLVEFQMVCQ